MTLIFPASPAGKPQGAPEAGLHVFVAGVSSYLHLPGGMGKPGTYHFGLKQLSAAATSAHGVCQWILDNRERFPLPLASCRLLLSPTKEEAKAVPLFDQIEECTLQNFLKEADAWREDARSSPGNMTLFYFAGHGIQTSGNDATLLLEDFNAPGGGRLRNAVAVGNILAGMAPSSIQPDIARTQAYFVDTCRVHPSEVRKFPDMNTTDVFDVKYDVEPEDAAAEPVILDDRAAPIFFAAVSGDAAYSRPGAYTYFSKALLSCLGGKAGLKIVTPYGQVKWRVTAYSLSTALREVLNGLKQSSGVPLNYSVGGVAQDFHLLDLEGAPQTEVVIEVDPEEARPVTRFEVFDSCQAKVWDAQSPLHPYPYRSELTPGEYTINAVIDPETRPYTNVLGDARPVIPPLTRWVIKVVQS